VTLGFLTTPQGIPADTFLAEELAHEDTVEMANLTSVQTGVPGTIFISTAMGAHGPRVIFCAAGAHPAELFGLGNRHADSRRQQPAGAHRSANVAPRYRLGVPQQG